MNPTEHLVLSALHHFSDTNGNITQTTAAIGAFIGRSSPAVGTALHRLVDKGYIHRLPRTSARSVGRFKIIGQDPTENRGKSLVNIEPLLVDAQGLPDVFRSPALKTAGVLHRAAPKGQEATVGELLGLGVVRSPKTMRKALEQLSALPFPLATEHADPGHRQRRVWIIHPLTTEAEASNLAYLNKIPGAEPKTRAQHEQENAVASRNYMLWFGGHPDVTVAYDDDVAPFISPDPQNIGCMVWTGQVNASGYGQPYEGRPFLTAHRMSWLSHVGYLAPGHALHHACGNRRCVYPGHLVPMTSEQHRDTHN